MRCNTRTGAVPGVQPCARGAQQRDAHDFDVTARPRTQPNCLVVEGNRRTIGASAALRMRRDRSAPALPRQKPRARN
jgi:hypothetical protein